MPKLIKFFLLFICFFSQAEQDIVISNAWIRRVNENMKSSNLFLTITNNSNKTDYLTAVSSPISNKIILHKTVIKNNIAQSVKISIIAIPAKTSIELAPAGINFILQDLEFPIKAGKKIEFIFSFSNAGDIKKTATVLQ